MSDLVHDVSSAESSEQTSYTCVRFCFTRRVAHNAFVSNTHVSTRHHSSTERLQKRRTNQLKSAPMLRLKSWVQERNSKQRFCNSLQAYSVPGSWRCCLSQIFSRCKADVRTSITHVLSHSSSCRVLRVLGGCPRVGDTTSMKSSTYVSSISPREPSWPTQLGAIHRGHLQSSLRHAVPVSCCCHVNKEGKIVVPPQENFESQLSGGMLSPILTGISFHILPTSTFTFAVSWFGAYTNAVLI